MFPPNLMLSLKIYLHRVIQTSATSLSVNCFVGILSQRAAHHDAVGEENLVLRRIFSITGSTRE